MRISNAAKDFEELPQKVKTATSYKTDYIEKVRFLRRKKPALTINQHPINRLLSRGDAWTFELGICLLKRFAFVSDAATREYRDLPDWVQDEFGKDLMRVQFNGHPELAIKQLSSIGPGLIELILNGSPAYRCLYIAKYADTVFVLHSFVKTTNGTDRHAMKIAQDRLKELKRELRLMGFKV